MLNEISSIDSFFQNKENSNIFKSPALHEYTTDKLNYALQFNLTNNTYRQINFKYLSNESTNIVDLNKISNKFDDYFCVESENTLKLEELGSQNSLFLALARCFLYKIYFEDFNYEYVLRNAYLKNISFIQSFQFDSDMALQEIIRKKLCLHWLENAYNINKFNCTKYSR
jgi:hypothetical protein